MRCRFPQPPKAVRFVVNSLSFNHFQHLADIPCVLGNGVEGAAPSTQPVTLYITLNITPTNLNNSPPRIPTEVSPTEESTIPERIQSPAPEHLLPLSHHQPVETGNAIPQSREEVSHSSAKNPRLALDRADEAMNPIDRSNTWESAVGRIKWVMDTLSPIVEVSIIPFDVPG
jgi:hypothetical protein